MKPLKAPVLYGDQGTNGQIKETCIEPECHRQWDQTDTGIVPSKIGRAKDCPYGSLNLHRYLEAVVLFRCEFAKGLRFYSLPPSSTHPSALPLFSNSFPYSANKS